MINTLHHDNKRIAKNTLYLYLRSIFVLAITVFTSRIILDVLGVEDYGIYNVVGGFVAMFSMLSGTLVAASQRFIAFELGKANPELKRVFSTTVSVHIFLALLILILLETIGQWFLNFKMNVSADRIVAANWVYQCSVFTFCANLVSIPYNATIIAYEKMSVFAYISILEVIVKLVSVYGLYVISLDSLKVYAVFMMIIAIFLCLINIFYCYRRIPDCYYDFSLHKQTFIQILNFSGWNFVGSVASNLNGHGINILINIFFGVTLNAARGVAAQVDHAINTFVSNFLMAITPQITKSYAAKDFIYVNKVIITGTKFSSFLLFIIGLPICLNAEFILRIWLKEVPLYAAEFVRLGILYTMCQTLSQCIYRTMLASGNIKKYQIVVGGISILAFPLAYFFFSAGYSVTWGYWSMIFFSIICLIARLGLLCEILPIFSLKKFLIDAILPIFVSVLPVILLVYCIHKKIECVTIYTFIIETLECLFITTIFIWIFGFTHIERQKCINILKDKLFFLK